jgi:hypothetical protein
LWEAFLIQMNDFDRFLESELRHMLDHVVATRAPRRGRTKGRGRPLLALLYPTEPAAEAFPEVAPIPVPVVAPLVP